MRPCRRHQRPGQNVLTAVIAIALGCGLTCQRAVGLAIEAESQAVAEEAVRLERARIARELHDIVAHCVSVMVVQAYAGELLTAADPDAAAEAFDQIADTASQADREIAYLVSLLVDEGSPADPLGPFPGAASSPGSIFR